MLVSASLQGVCVLDSSQQTLCLVERSFGRLESFLAAILTILRKLTYAICAFIFIPRPFTFSILHVVVVKGLR